MKSDDPTCDRRSDTLTLPVGFGVGGSGHPSCGPQGLRRGTELLRRSQSHGVRSRHAWIGVGVVKLHADTFAFMLLWAVPTVSFVLAMFFGGGS